MKLKNSNIRSQLESKRGGKMSKMSYRIRSTVTSTILTYLNQHIFLELHDQLLGQINVETFRRLTNQNN